jgi:hypothetical protein
MQVGVLVLLLQSNWVSPVVVEVVSDKFKINERELVEVDVYSVDMCQ